MGTNEKMLNKKWIIAGALKSAIASFTQRIMSSAPSEEECFETGKRFFLNGQYAKAQKMLRTAQRLNPKNFNAALLLGKAYKQNGQVIKAFETLTRAEGIAPDTDELRKNLYFELGMICYLKNDLEKAKQYMAAVLTMSPLEKNAQRMLARIHHDMGDREQELQAYIKLLALGCETSREKESVLFELGNIYFKQNKRKEAVQRLHEVLAINPSHIEARILLAKTYFGSDDIEQGVVIYRKLLAQRCIDDLDTDDYVHAVRKLSQREDFVQSLQKVYAGNQGSETRYKELWRAKDQVRYFNSINDTVHAAQRAKEALSLVPATDRMLRNLFLNEIEIAERKVHLASKVRSLLVVLTNKCNLDCIMCYLKEGHWDLPAKAKDEIIKLLPYLESLCLQGGEAFLYKDFRELIREAAKYPVRVTITTNALLFNEHIARELVEHNMNITISIDAITKEIYGKIRKGGNFDQLIKNITMLNTLREETKSRTRTQMNVIIMDSNWHQIEDFVTFAHRYKFDTLYLNQLCGHFTAPTEDVFYARTGAKKRNRIYHALAQGEKKAKEYGIILENWIPSSVYIEKINNKHVSAQPVMQGAAGVAGNGVLCNAPWQKLIIENGGTVRPECYCMGKNSVGNICKDSIEDLWNGPGMREYRTKLIEKREADICSPDCVLGRIPRHNLKPL